MNLSKSVSITLTTRLLLLAIAIGTSIIIARYLGPSGKGAFAVLGVISGIAVQFSNIGLHSANVFFVSRDRESLPRVAANSIWVAIFLGAPASALAFLVFKFYPSLFLGSIDPKLLVIILIAVPFSLATLLLQRILVAAEKIYQFNLIELGARLSMFLLAVALLIFLHKGIFALVLLSTATSAVISLFYFGYVYRSWKLPLRFDFRLYNQMLRYGFKAYLANLFAFLLLRFDLLLVGFFVGAAGAGFYSVAFKFTTTLYLLPSTIGLMLVPKVASNLEDKGLLTQKVCRHVAPIMLLVCIAAAVLAKPLITLMYGSQFTPAVAPFLWLLPGLFFLSLHTILSQDLAGRGMPPITYIAPAVAFGANLGLDLWLIPRFGVSGASIASSISYALSLGLLIEYHCRTLSCSRKDLIIPRWQEVKEAVANGRERLALQRIVSNLPWKNSGSVSKG